MFKTQDLETAADQYGNGIVPANSIGHKNGDALIELNGTTTPYATGANGSIITMTLKNNHLIVETEERSVRLDVVLNTIFDTFPIIFIFSRIKLAFVFFNGFVSLFLHFNTNEPSTIDYP